MVAGERQTLRSGVVRMLRSLLTLLCIANLAQDAAGQTRSMLLPVSRYRNNPEYVVDRRANPEFSFIGEIESSDTLYDKSGNVLHYYSTAIIVSPCLALTNHHVVFGDELRPQPGKSYAMKLRAGVSPNRSIPFLGSTTATPVAYGRRGAAASDDWALLRLTSCIGERPEIGWIDFSLKSPADLIGNAVAVAGFAGDRNRGCLSFSLGKAMSIDPANGMVKYSASASGGQSGGAVLMKEDGETRLVGIHTLEFLGPGGVNTFDAYDPQQANEFTPLANILNHPEVRKLIADDRARALRNPAHRRQVAPWPMPGSGSCYSNDQPTAQPA